MPDAPPPDWRDSETDSTEPSGVRPWQTRGSSSAEPSILPSKRSLWRIVALFSVITIAVAISVILLMPRQVKPACLVLIGAGYEHNLFLPHNVYGWNGLKKLHAEVASDGLLDGLWPFGADQPTKLRQIDAPFELKEKGWPETWDKIAKKIRVAKEKTVVLFISLHGFADGAEAYLLPDDPNVRSVESFNRTRIPFSDVLASLQSVDKEKKIVLFLDVCHVQAHWPIGMLHNDFVERLASKHEEKIKEMGNLTVICSTSPDERSWASEERQQSMFAYYVTQALKGEGQGEDVALNAGALFDHVKKKVDDWAKANRARNQTPTLLGRRSVADGVELVHVTAAYQEPDSEPRKFDPKDLEAEWLKCVKLKKEHAPQVDCPHLWRLYQETLLRYEQLLRAGDPTGKAAKLKVDLQTLHADIVAAGVFDTAFECLGNSFPIYRLLGFRPNEAVSDKDLRDFLDAKNDEKKGGPLDQFKSVSEKRYLQTRLSRLILTDHLDRAGMFDHAGIRKQLALIAKDLGAEQRSVEAHLVKMLEHVDPAMDAETLKLAVRVRMLAEEVALSVPGEREGADEDSSELYAEAIFRRVQMKVEKADELRRAGEDLLFGAAGVQPVSHDKLNEADALYKQVRDEAAKLQRTLALRDKVAAELPFLAAWLALHPPAKEEALIQDLRSKAETLGASLGALTGYLDRKEGNAPELAALEAMADDLKELRDAYQRLCANLKRTSAGLQKDWHAIDAALGVPLVEADGAKNEVALRIALLKKQREISGELHTSRKPAATTEQEDSVKNRVERQRKLLRACLQSFPDVPGSDRDAHVDEKVRDFYLKLPDEIIAKSEGSAADEASLVAAVERCRIVPGALADQVRNKKSERINPAEQLRRWRTCELLQWQAQRTLDDHWFEPDPKNAREATYYIPAGKAYLDSAASVLGKMPDSRLAQKTDDMRLKLVEAGLTLSKGPAPYWTTETRFWLEWQIKPDERSPQGVPMAWLEVVKGSKKAEPWQPKAREKLSLKEPCTAAFVLEKRDFEDNNGNINVVFHAFYRGQHLMKPLPLVRPEPDLIVRHPSAPDKALFAVQMDSAFNYGAISIVLDNSGSMKFVHPVTKKEDIERYADVKKEKRRFDFALAALKHVLSTIPDKTTLSMFTLGRRALPEEARDVPGIIKLRPPTPWRQEELKDELVRLKGLPADIGSPIADGIVRSMREGFPTDGFKGPKVVLVLTDGDDNASFNSSYDKSKKKQIDDHTQRVVEGLMDASEAHPDVRVIVICFIRKDDEEYERAEAQFRCVERFKSKGNLRMVSEANELGATIEDLIRPRVQLKEIDGKALPLFENGQPVNYPNDNTLKWTRVETDYQDRTLLASIMKFGSAKKVEAAPGRNIFALLKRDGNTLHLERGVVGRHPEILKIARNYQAEKDDWLVTLVENRNFQPSQTLSQLLVFEKPELEPTMRQTHPGFAWLELEPVPGAGKRPEKTLTWGKEWTMPAAAFRLEMPSWPKALPPKVTAWFWPDERGKFLFTKDLTPPIRSSFPVDNDSPTQRPAGRSEAGGIEIDSVLWEPKKEIIDENGSNVKTKRDCLVVRLRYPKGRPYFVVLDPDKNHPERGEEHSYYFEAGTCTATFYNLDRTAEVNLLLVDIEAFKAATRKTSVSFAPEELFVAPTMFRRRFD